MATMLQRFMVITLMAFVLFAYIASADEEKADATEAAAVTEAAAAEGAAITEAAAADGAAATERPRKVRPIRSLLQACRKDIGAICTDKKALVKCLADNSEKITDETCKTWVNARDVCMKAAKGNAACGPKDSARQCLRSVDATTLPEECTKSDFFKSVKMFGMFRRSSKSIAKKPIAAEIAAV